MGGIVVGIVVIAGVVIVGISEAALRWFGLGNPVLYYESESYRYAVAPSQSTTRFRDAAIRINQHGSRTDDNWDAPAARKILFVGDSVTYGGSYIDNAQLFSSVTCRTLRDQGKPAVCGNVGTNGYGVENMAMRIRFGTHPQPDVYVVTIIGGDTLRGTASLASFPYFSKPLPPLIPAITEASLFVLDQFRAELRFDRIGGPYQGQGPDAKSVASLALARLIESLKIRESSGASAVLVYSPLKHAASDGYTDFDQFVIARLVASGFPVLDMRERLAENADLDNLFYDGTHLDVSGHERYGAVIAHYLAHRPDSMQVEPQRQGEITSL